MDYPQRKNIRLRGYDYSQGGAYFCTICVHRCHRRKSIFGTIEDEEMNFNRFGHVAQRAWLEASSHRPNVLLDESIVMPNHFHGLLWLEAPEQIVAVQSRFGPQIPGSLATAIGAFKADVTKTIRRLLKNADTVVWQRRFHDRIVRSDAELLAIRRYIQLNPAQWTSDRCHPDHPDFERVWQDLSPDPETFL